MGIWEGNNFWYQVIARNTHKPGNNFPLRASSVSPAHVHDPTKPTISTCGETVPPKALANGRTTAELDPELRISEANNWNRDLLPPNPWHITPDNQR